MRVASGLALAITLLFTVSWAGCGSEAPDSSAAAAPSTSPVATVGDPVADGYDAVRDALADDDLPRAKAAARDLAAVAGAPAAQAHAVAAAADFAAARKAFGDLSQAYITWLQDKAPLKAKLHAFRCPMALGYKKWVQQAPEMANPYMGKRMLQCGGKTELVP